MINRTDYVAAHIRVADAHWDAADCQHKMNGNPISSVSCGDGLNVINYSSIAQEIWYVLRISGDKKQARGDGSNTGRAIPPPLSRSSHPAPPPLHRCTSRPTCRAPTRGWCGSG